MGSFAGDGGRSAIILSEQVEVVAHWFCAGFLFSFSLQILALRRLLRRAGRLQIQ